MTRHVKGAGTYEIYRPTTEEKFKVLGCLVKHVGELNGKPADEVLAFVREKTGLEKLALSSVKNIRDAGKLELNIARAIRKDKGTARVAEKAANDEPSVRAVFDAIQEDIVETKCDVTDLMLQVRHMQQRIEDLIVMVGPTVPDKVAA